SLFWGGLIPRQEPWELASWPASVRDYLLTSGYHLAEQALNSTQAPPTAYQNKSRENLRNLIPGFTATDAVMAVQYTGATPLSIPAGLSSPADLLMEDRLVDDPGYRRPTINLNTAAWSITTDPSRPTHATGVLAWDMLAQRQRTYRARTVVLAAGTIESAKIAL